MRYQFHHIAISVSDLEKSSRWYQEIFGFKETGTFHREDLDVGFKYLVLEDLILEIFQSNHSQALPGYRKELKSDLTVQGVKHFALSVDDPQRAYKELKEQGVEFLTEVLTGASGKRYVFLRDPDGILIELLES